MSNKKSESSADLSTVDVDSLHLPFIRTAYDGSNLAASNASILHFDPENAPSLTKQHFVNECDINTILSNFAKTGILTHVNNNQPQFVDMTLLPDDYHAALNTIINASEMFNNLPAAIRDRFNNNPEELLAFLSDPANKDEAIKLGLVDPSPAVDGAGDAPGSSSAGGDPSGPTQPGVGSPPASA